jgi:hypothetical protein
MKTVGEELKQQTEASMAATQALSSKAAVKALTDAQNEMAAYEKTVKEVATQAALLPRKGRRIQFVRPLLVPTFAIIL